MKIEVKIWCKEKNKFITNKKSLDIEKSKKGESLIISSPKELVISTGLLDVDGNTIFDGDIVQINKYRQSRLYVLTISEGTIFIDDYYTKEVLEYERHRIRVVGNTREDGTLTEVIKKRMQ